LNAYGELPLRLDRAYIFVRSSSGSREALTSHTRLAQVGSGREW